MTTTDTHHRWRWLLPFLLAAFAGAAWASFTSQRQLGIYMGWPQPWLMPAILDNLAAGTLLAYILLPGRSFTRWASATVLAVSGVANAQAHFYDPAIDQLGVPVWVAMLWSVLPPAAMFTIAHFIVLARRDTDDTRAGDRKVSRRGETGGSAGDDRRGAAGDLGTGQPATTANGSSGSPRGDRASHPPRPARAAKRGGRKTQPAAADIAAWLVDQGYNPGDIGRRRLMELRGDITDHRARQALELFTGNGHP